MIITIDTDKLHAEYAAELPEIQVAGIMGIFTWLTRLTDDVVSENIKSGAITLTGDVR